ncbi:MAG: DNA-binding protein [Tahibacter sp.]
MARNGITQEQVNAAADVLLRAGERPTIERVRAALGTGSPNTLIRLLDVWWAALGQRLIDNERRLALPDAPESVARAAGVLWTLALEHAAATLTHERTEERNRLAAAQSDADRRVSEAVAAEAIAREATRVAEAAQGAALGRMLDLDRLVSHQAQQITDLHTQRHALTDERDRTRDRASTLADELRQATVAAAAERVLHDEQRQATEDRWLQEVDRARQETARLQSQLQRHEKESKQKDIEIERARAAVTTMERSHATATARLDAAAAETERLHRLLAETTAAGTHGRKKTVKSPSAQAGRTPPRKRR